MLYNADGTTSSRMKEQMLIRKSSNGGTIIVGIGTTTPDVKLHKSRF